MMHLIQRADMPLGRLRLDRSHDQKLAVTIVAAQTVRTKLQPS